MAVKLILEQSEESQQCCPRFVDDIVLVSALDYSEELLNSKNAVKTQFRAGCHMLNDAKAMFTH